MSIYKRYFPEVYLRVSLKCSYWLISNGVDPDRIIAKGYGEEYPRVPNDSKDNKRKNKRIEFKRIR